MLVGGVVEASGPRRVSERVHKDGSGRPVDGLGAGGGAESDGRVSTTVSGALAGTASLAPAQLFALAVRFDAFGFAAESPLEPDDDRLRGAAFGFGFGAAGASSESPEDTAARLASSAAMRSGAAAGSSASGWTAISSPAAFFSINSSTRSRYSSWNLAGSKSTDSELM